jgi:uncharacterized membrane protein YgaE (UPF0421/DUF939 family)
VALIIIVLVNLDITPGRAALVSFLKVSLGIVVALAVTLLIFSPKPLKTTSEQAPMNMDKRSTSTYTWQQV